MRNLKKFLALVMAMVMAFSLMVNVSAATTGTQYTDVNDVTPAFEKAVDVLTGMKVYQGDAEAPTFRPGSNITRAEVAALIYRLATGDTGTEKMKLYTTQHPFTDVRADAWYAGYVGYCWNAGYIKGTTATTFNPSDNVTGYEVLAMILRAVGYDKNNEFTGPTWQVNVSALSTQLGILNDVKSTHYGDTLHLASRRDVVASLLFRTAAYVPQVVYTVAFGYQNTGMSGGVVGSTLNPTLGRQNFGLDNNDNGVVIGNQQTGETATVVGYAGSAVLDITGSVVGGDQSETSGSGVQMPTTGTTGGARVEWNQYAYGGLDNIPLAGGATGSVSFGNVRYNLETGIDLMGHRVELWFDNRGTTHTVYAYYDKATTDVVKADNTNLLAANNVDATDTDLYQAIAAAGFSTSGSAVFNNSFGLFGIDPDATINGTPGTGEATSSASAFYDSAVNLYKIIDNNGDKSVDAVIALNIESSQITEANTVNRVPTLGIPVDNAPNGPSVIDNDFVSLPGTGGLFQTHFVAGSVPQATGAADANVKGVGTPSVDTGVIAQAALVGNSTKTLGDYEMGIHITGTQPRTVSGAEATAINNQTAADLDTAYFLLNKVTATVEGTVVAYNNVTGTVTLQNGTVLNRSKFYETVVDWTDTEPNANPAPATKIPQGWVQGADGFWEEGYANVGYKFYTDYAGNYLGAERSYGSSFLYGTYLDYDQKTSTSTFNYYLTGVTMNGDIETKQVASFWALDNTGAAQRYSINGTNELRVPFRATNSAATLYAVNGLGFGQYIGFAFTGTTADSLVGDPSTNVQRGEYLNNMRRLGIWQADETNGGITLDANTTITNTSTTLGAQMVGTTAGVASNRYFTEATKFILVSGFGTDSVKAQVFNGISELKGTSTSVVLRLGETMGPASLTPNIVVNGIIDAVDNTIVPVDEMTYYTESPYTYAQSGDTAMKIDTIILPAAAVSWAGGSGLYYVGNPTASLTNSWGTDAWKYTMYVDGEAQQVWLTNQPGITTAGDARKQLYRDSFYHLVNTGLTANDGQPIYTAGWYNADGSWTSGDRLDDTIAWSDGLTGYDTGRTGRPTRGFMDNQTYSAVTRDAQTATFAGEDKNITTAGDNILLRVAGAKVVNLNEKATRSNPDGTGVSSGEIWPGITDLQTLNQAGSIDPVTARSLKVAAVMDPSNNLIVNTIYVCWDQD